MAYDCGIRTLGRSASEFSSGLVVYYFARPCLVACRDNVCQYCRLCPSSLRMCWISHSRKGLKFFLNFFGRIRHGGVCKEDVTVIAHLGHRFCLSFCVPEQFLGRFGSEGLLSEKLWSVIIPSLKSELSTTRLLIPTEFRQIFLIAFLPVCIHLVLSFI